MDYEKDEQVIYFKDLIFTALYQWRRILVFALVFALLLGGFTAVTKWKEYTVSAGTITEAQESHEKLQKQYEAQKQTLQAEMETTVLRLEDIQKAAKESPLSKVDAYSVYTAYALYTANLEQTVSLSGQGVLRDETHTVMQGYNALLTGQTAADALAKELGFDARYIGDVLNTTYEKESRTLKVEVTYTSIEAAQKGLQLLQELMADAKAGIAGATKTHTLQLVMEDMQNISYEQLQEKQKAQDELTRDLTDHLTELEDMMSQLVAPAAPEQLSKTNVLKKTVIFGVIGGILGAFMVVAWHCLRHLMGAKVYSKRTLWGRTHIDTIATMAEPAGNKIDTWLRQLEGRDVAEESREICENLLQQYCAGNENTLVLYCGVKPLQQLEKALENKAAFATANTLQAVENLAKCHNVILVAKCHATRYDLMEQQAKQVAALGKNLLGCLLIGG